MTRVKPEHRRRARAPKVRTGCATCKVRRVKCDENRPACVRCTSTGRVCDGYEPEAGAAIRTLSIPQSLSVRTNPQEARSLQFFIERTAGQFTMFFQEEWWNTQILQLAHFESSIRHALVALATYHEQYTRRIAGTDTLFAARQQNLAIQKLLLPTQQPLTYVHLVTCSIFICIEVLQGNHEAAIRLFKHGRGMLEQLQLQRACRASAYEPPSDVYASICFMETLFTRLAIQVSMLVGDVHPELSMELLGQIKFSPPLSNRPINSLLEARQTLTDLIVYSIQAISGSDERRQCVKSFLNIWLVTFKVFRDRQHGNTPDDSERRGSALLNLHAKCLLLILDLAGREGVEGVLLKWDDYTERYQILLEAAALAMERGDGEKTPVFHLELGVVPVLFIIISQCRDPVVRRQAIGLLKRSQVQEGVWSSELTGKVAQRVMDLEEAGITVQQPSDIPAERRISSVVVHLEEGQRRATVTYTGQAKERKELVEW